MVMTVGCGSSTDDGGPAGAGGTSLGGYQVEFSAEDLGELFPDPLALPDHAVDPEIKKITLLVYDVDRVLVAHVSSSYTTGAPYAQTIQGLPVAPYDVIIAARDGSDILLGAIKARSVFPLIDGRQILRPGLFDELQGFVLPDGV